MEKNSKDDRGYDSGFGGSDFLMAMMEGSIFGGSRHMGGLGGIHNKETIERQQATDMDECIKAAHSMPSFKQICGDIGFIECVRQALNINDDVEKKLQAKLVMSVIDVKAKVALDTISELNRYIGMPVMVFSMLDKKLKDRQLNSQHYGFRKCFDPGFSTEHMGAWVTLSTLEFWDRYKESKKSKAPPIKPKAPIGLWGDLNALFLLEPIFGVAIIAYYEMVLSHESGSSI